MEYIQEQRTSPRLPPNHKILGIKKLDFKTERENPYLKKQKTKRDKSPRIEL